MRRAVRCNDGLRRASCLAPASPAHRKGHAVTYDTFAWAETLDGLHAQVWTRLTRGVHDRHAAARHPTLATVSADGMPRARTVVLRRVDRETSSLDLHTDLHSAKVAELRANPLAALHVWDASAHLQMRLETRASILSGETVAAIWERVPEASRASYGGLPHPGHPIADALDYTRTSDPAAFVVLRLQVQAMDVLHLGKSHRRARFESRDNWAGQWLAP